jgi:hypothetical protein
MKLPAVPRPLSLASNAADEATVVGGGVLEAGERGRNGPGDGVADVDFGSVRRRRSGSRPERGTGGEAGNARMCNVLHGNLLKSLKAKVVSCLRGRPKPRFRDPLQTHHTDSKPMPQQKIRSILTSLFASVHDYQYPVRYWIRLASSCRSSTARHRDRIKPGRPYQVARSKPTEPASSAPTSRPGTPTQFPNPGPNPVSRALDQDQGPRQNQVRSAPGPQKRRSPAMKAGLPCDIMMVEAGLAATTGGDQTTEAQEGNGAGGRDDADDVDAR